jgi:hypothetical protein
MKFGLYDAGTYPDFPSVKSAFEETYACLGMTCDQVGALVGKTVACSSAPSSPPAPMSDVTQTLALNTGWTWLSSPLLAGDTNDVLGGLSGLASHDDEIKSQFLFTSYLEGFGWFGQLSQLSPSSLYKMRLATGGNFVLSRTPADPAGETITLFSGWTWIGWPSMTRQPISVFDAALKDYSKLTTPDERIKSQYKFTTFIPTYGWFGELTHFEPGFGYMVKLSQANELIGFGAQTRRQRKLEAVGFETQPALVVGSGDWQLTPAAFENSMCVVAVVVIDEEITGDGELAAFVNGQLHGVAQPSSYTAPVGSYKGHKSYNLMVYGQMETEGVTVTFSYRQANGQVSLLGVRTVFAKDSFLGSVVDPFVISHSTAHVSDSPPETAVHSVSTAQSTTASDTLSASPLLATYGHVSFEGLAEDVLPESGVTTNLIAIAVGTLTLLVLIVLCMRCVLVNSKVGSTAVTHVVVQP